MRAPSAERCFGGSDFFMELSRQISAWGRERCRPTDSQTFDPPPPAACNSVCVTLSVMSCPTELAQRRARLVDFVERRTDLRRCVNRAAQAGESGGTESRLRPAHSLVGCGDCRVERGFGRGLRCDAFALVGSHV